MAPTTPAMLANSPAHACRLLLHIRIIDIYIYIGVDDGGYISVEQFAKPGLGAETLRKIKRRLFIHAPFDSY